LRTGRKMLANRKEVECLCFMNAEIGGAGDSRYPLFRLFADKGAGIRRLLPSVFCRPIRELPLVHVIPVHQVDAGEFLRHVAVPGRGLGPASLPPSPVLFI
jgi:hypothetical protein